MSIPAGAKIPSRWSPLRAEVERVLADGAWHEAELLYRQVERFIDPRVAARSWAREYRHNAERHHDEEEIEPASRVLARNQLHALGLGRWRVYWDVIRAMRRAGHVETEVWGGRRRVRLKPR